MKEELARDMLRRKPSVKFSFPCTGTKMALHPGLLKKVIKFNV